MFHAPVLKRDRGTGRPTKRDRREIDDLQDGFLEGKGQAETPEE
jgi:ribosome-associated heat shock protein Hsp15